MNRTHRFASVAISGLLAELRRRHVFRVAVGYGAVSWMVLEVSSATFPPLGIPDWSLSLLAMLLILGFPVAMVLAWAFDITPAGVQRTAANAAAPEGSVRTHGIAGDTAAFPEQARAQAGRRSGPPEPPGPGHTVATRTSALAVTSPAMPSIAALPFTDVSEEGRYQFLGDGIADELINGLARGGGLRVVARTSSFSFRDTVADVREIAARLDVGFVIEGSIRINAGRLRINAQLIDARSGYAIWSDTYDRDAADLLAVQEEVARAVTAVLPVPGTAPSPATRILTETTDDVEAWTHYLRGRALWLERSPSALRGSGAHFEAAIRRDPGFAQAWAGIADSLGILVDHGVADPAITLPIAREAADRALRLAPQLAEAHASDALVRQLEGDVVGAEHGFRHACALNPALSPARQRLALLCAWSRRFDEARLEIDAATAYDPLSPVIAASRAWIEYHAGNPEGALTVLQPVLDEHPRFTHARVPLALALLQLERPGEAAAALQLHLAASERTAAVVALHVHALALAGDAAGAAARMSALERLARRRFVPAHSLAVACVGLGRYDDALQHLQDAAAHRAPQLIHLSVDPLFRPLRGRPGFEALLEA